VFVSAILHSVSALAVLPKKLLIPRKLGYAIFRSAHYTCADPKIAYLNFPGLDICIGKSVSALTVGRIALTNTNKILLGWIYFRVVGCLRVGGMKLADPDFPEKVSV